MRCTQCCSGQNLGALSSSGAVRCTLSLETLSMFGPSARDPSRSLPSASLGPCPQWSFSCSPPSVFSTISPVLCHPREQCDARCPRRRSVGWDHLQRSLKISAVCITGTMPTTVILLLLPLLPPSIFNTISSANKSVRSAKGVRNCSPSMQGGVTRRQRGARTEKKATEREDIRYSTSLASYSFPSTLLSSTRM